MNSILVCDYITCYKLHVVSDVNWHLKSRGAPKAQDSCSDFLAVTGPVLVVGPQ